MGIKQFLETTDTKYKHITNIKLNKEELTEEHELIAH